MYDVNSNRNLTAARRRGRREAGGRRWRRQIGDRTRTALGSNYGGLIGGQAWRTMDDDNYDDLLRMDCVRPGS